MRHKAEVDVSWRTFAQPKDAKGKDVWQQSAEAENCPPPPQKTAKRNSCPGLGWRGVGGGGGGGGGGVRLGAAQSTFGCPCNFGSHAGSATRHGFTTRVQYKLTSWGQRWAGPALSNTYETKPTRGGVFRASANRGPKTPPHVGFVS